MTPSLRFTAVDSGGEPTDVCEGGHAAEASHAEVASGDKPMARIDVAPGGEFDLWLDRNAGAAEHQGGVPITVPMTTDNLLAMLQAPGFATDDGAWECAEDMLAFEYVWPDAAREDRKSVV